MATAYVAEFAEVDLAPVEPRLTQGTIATSGTSAQSAAFGSTTRVIAVSSPAAQAVSYRVGINPTALTTDPRLPANGVYYFVVTPGQKIALIDVT